MKRIFITGSSDGLGLYSAQKLQKLGHEVVLHARDEQKAKEAALKFDNKVKVLVADLADFDAVKKLAKEVNALGVFDVIIHNAGVLHVSAETILKVNVLAPFMLTALIQKPKHLMYIGSNMHPQGKVDFTNLSLTRGVDYSTSKLQILMLSFAMARRLEGVRISTVDPGWVKTKMANYNAPDSLEDGTQTQVWLCDSDDEFTCKYFYHLKEANYSSKVDDIQAQEELVKQCEKLTGITFK